MLIKLFTLYIYLQTSLCGCGPDRRSGGFEKPAFGYELERVGRLDERVQESSGLAKAGNNTFWTHGDGGTPAALYRVGLNGELLQTVPLDLQNLDWEELAEDEQYLYLGDFGNNLNNRRDLRIHRIRKSDLRHTGTTAFSLEDQTAFPPADTDMRFDLEAFFHHQDSLYLFNKSRGKDKQLKLYTLPAQAAKEQAVLREQLPIHAMATAADISPDGKQFAVLAYGKLYLFEVENGAIHLNAKRYCIPVAKTGQAEAVLYLSPGQLLITNENGKMFTLTIGRGAPAAKAH
ncbi:MAG: hypothetical protein LPK07_00305 [Hymenobacteraceae bacterium]|nr:hypothetical protein [Hymenobacteraceae bacterium]